MSQRLEDVDAWLRSLGFVKESTRGSHMRFRHRDTNYAITVACHGRELERWQLAHLLRQVEQMGATETTSRARNPKRTRESE